LDIASRRAFWQTIRAPQSGVSGYVLKDAPVDQLVDTVRRVHAGQRVVDPALAVAAWDGADPMTDRENRIEAARVARDRGWL
jgi:DNA-binding NarL/FixJ family response regulator